MKIGSNLPDASILSYNVTTGDARKKGEKIN